MIPGGHFIFLTSLTMVRESKEDLAASGNGFPLK